jgi:HK97 family phage major capsid protein
MEMATLTQQADAVLAVARQETGSPRPDPFSDETLDRVLGPRPDAVAKAFIGWLRSRDTADLVSKAAIVEDATGKVLVPVEIAADALAIAQAGVFRSLASIRPTIRKVHRAGLLTAAATGWGQLELGTVATDANTVPENPAQEVEVWDLVTLCTIGVDELDDTTEAARAAIVEVLGTAQRAAEDAAFAVGTAAGTPRGIVNAANLARIPAGNKIAVSVSNTPTWAQLSSLPFLLDDQYRDNGTWIMHKTSAGKVAALPEATNFEPGPSGRGLLGYPVRILSSLPDPATAGTGDASILFTDLRSAYRIADRLGMRIQRLTERYAEVGKVGMLATTRVGGDLVRPAAVAVYTQ